MSPAQPAAEERDDCYGGWPIFALTSLSWMEVGLVLRTMGLKGVSGSTNIFLMVEEFIDGE